ncbi:MAG TPA: HlyD family efflux transporter periplasmic adaptor subunit [Rhizomicrobium sp.]|nr:HlyD family efflux transporter periplasmic adaptor subunit [Rhizomicrobium sp.]
MKKLSLLIALLPLLGACEQQKEQPWLGYGEGDTAYISAPQPGWVTVLKVERGALVRRGDLLFVLDSVYEQAGAQQAVANLAQARAGLTQEIANLAYAKTTLDRQNRLARDNAGTPTQRDLALSNYRQSEARIAQLRSQIAQMEAGLTSARYGLGQRDIVAQTEGRVQDIYFREGEYVPAATPVVAVLPPKNVFVRFFVPEPDLPRIKLGGTVRITCDGCKAMDAKVTFLAAREEFTQPVIFSQGNREKLVFKAEARLPQGLDLHPGQPVEVRPL